MIISQLNDLLKNGIKNTVLVSLVGKRGMYLDK